MDIREDIKIRDEGGGGTAPTQEQELQKKGLHTGELRDDLEIIEGGKDENGRPVWVISDPVSGNYYRTSEKDYQIIRCISRDQDLDEFLSKLKASGVLCEKAEVIKILSFLMHNNLMKTPYGHSELRAQQTREMKKRMFWHILLSTYQIGRAHV